MFNLFISVSLGQKLLNMAKKKHMVCQLHIMVSYFLVLAFLLVLVWKTKLEERQPQSIIRLFRVYLKDCGWMEHKGITQKYAFM